MHLCASQLGALLRVRTLHAPTRQLSLAPCVLISPFTWMRSSVAQASAAERWSMMDFECAENCTPCADGIPVDDATAHAQAHRRGVAWPLFELRRCRAALRKRTLTPHTIPGLNMSASLSILCVSGLYKA